MFFFRIKKNQHFEKSFIKTDTWQLHFESIYNQNNSMNFNWRFQWHDICDKWIQWKNVYKRTLKSSISINDLELKMVQKLILRKYIWFKIYISWNQFIWVYKYIWNFYIEPLTPYVTLKINLSRYIMKKSFDDAI